LNVKIEHGKIVILGGNNNAGVGALGRRRHTGFRGWSPRCWGDFYSIFQKKYPFL